MRRRGFTVIEVIIVMAIFSIVLGVIIQIFIFTSRTQRRSRSVQEAYAQARAAVEALAREGQNGTVDYAFYGPPGEPAHSVDIASQPVAVAAFRSSQGTDVRFRCAEPLAANPNQACSGSTPELGQVQMCRGSACASGGWAGITDEATDVVSWSTWVGPTDDPFARDRDDPANYAANRQPWVTAAISVRPAAVAGSQPPEVRLQATVSSRSYQR